MVIHAPLDLDYWFNTILSGSAEIFTLIAIISITFLSAKFKLGIMPFIAMITLFTVLMGKTYGVNSILLIIILIGGLIGFTILRKTQD